MVCCFSETNPLGRTKSYTYDANRNKRTETDALNKTTTYDYDANGHLKSVTDPLNKTLSFTNNSAGLPVTATDQIEQSRETSSYDAKLNLTGVTDELGSTIVADLERSKEMRRRSHHGNGKTTRLTYDASATSSPRWIRWDAR